jgi:hypothetical protein
MACVGLSPFPLWGRGLRQGAAREHTLGDARPGPPLGIHLNDEPRPQASRQDRLVMALALIATPGCLPCLICNIP